MFEETTIVLKKCDFCKIANEWLWMRNSYKQGGLISVPIALPKKTFLKPSRPSDEEHEVRSSKHLRIHKRDPKTYFPLTLQSQAVV